MDKKFEKITFLYSSLKEAQDNIRTYDTKAQIVGIGYIFTIGMITKSIDIDFHQSNIILSLIILLLMLTPIVFFAAVLYPTRKLAPSILRNRSNVKAMYYPSPNELVSVDSFIKQFDDINIEDELAYELLKVSVLRNLKRKRFLRALLFASLSFGLLIVLQILPLFNI
ncbi:MAG: hypothetical protein JKX98_03895 [Alcanivoracaceae bacterium]|nr:hypothetical protein [Alcanivoracaceae bacterium]